MKEKKRVQNPRRAKWKDPGCCRACQLLLCGRESKETGSGKTEGWMRPTQQDQGEWGVGMAKDTKAQYMQARDG